MDVIPYESGSLYILIVHIMIIIVSIRTHDGSGFRCTSQDKHKVYNTQMETTFTQEYSVQL